MINLKRIHLFYVDEKGGKKENIKITDLPKDKRDLIKTFFREYKGIKKDKIIISPSGDKEAIISKIVKITPKLKPKFNLQNILIIGPQRSVGYHFSEQLYKQYKEMGYLVDYQSPLTLRDNEFNLYYDKQKRYPLSKVVKKASFFPDLIIIDECQFHWNNDTNIPCFYHQREFKRPPTVYDPNVVFMWHQGLLDYFKEQFAPEWMNNIEHHRVLDIAVDIEQFKPEKKKYKGVRGIGQREGDEFVFSRKELAHLASHVLMNKEEKRFKKLGLKFFDPPITDEKYRELMPQCEAVWVTSSLCQYISHRMLECMACKTICIIKLESWEHELVLKRMGFNNMEHYIGVDKLEEIEQIWNETSSKLKREIRDNAYNIVCEKHSTKKRANDIIDLYNELGYTSEKFDVICPIYWVDIEQFPELVNNWFKEIPIRKLYLGINNPEIELEINHPQIEIIDQTHLLTLGGCLKDLMNKVETNWFVYLHADIEITPYSFLVMKEYMKKDVGIIESERFEWDGHDHQKDYDSNVPLYSFNNYCNRQRGFSGFQLFQKKAIEPFLKVLEDDYLYRNEDMIFQSICKENGYKYEKSLAMHIHHIKNKKWTFGEEKTYEMQWKACIKYTQPTELTKYVCLNSIKYQKEKFKGLTLNQIMFFCFQHNPNWGYIVRKEYEKWNPTQFDALRGY